MAVAAEVANEAACQVSTMAAAAQANTVQQAIAEAVWISMKASEAAQTVVAGNSS